MRYCYCFSWGNHNIWNYIEIFKNAFLVSLVLHLNLFPSKHWSSWRRLRLQKTSSRRLHQDRYIHITHTSSENVLKTSWRRLDQGKYILLGHTSSKRLQDVFKTSCKNVFKTSTRHLEDVLKMSWKHFCKTFLQDALLRRFQDVFKTSSKRLAKMSSRHLQDIFKTFSRRIIKLNCSW